MYKIRAITLHVNFNKKFAKLEEVFEYIDKYLDRLELISRELGKDREVLSKRLVLPSLGELKARVGDFKFSEIEALEDYLKQRVDYYDVPIENLGYPNLEREIPRVFSNTNNLFLSIGLTRDDLNEESLTRAVTVLKDISREAGWISAARFAFSIGPQPLTPYFPVTSSPQTGYTVSLLYINDLLTQLFSKSDDSLAQLKKRIRIIYEELSRKALEASSRVGLVFLGIDLSISPWLEESIVPLIEAFKRNATTIGSPGTLHILYEINGILWEFSKKTGVTGFNEVMLPLAEDEGLKKRVREGDLRFKDFLIYCFVCAAGLDMIPIPEWTDNRLLMHLLKDLLSIYAVKKRTLGVRIIPVGVEAGGEVDLGIFGKTPVLDILK